MDNQLQSTFHLNRKFLISIRNFYVLAGITFTFACCTPVESELFLKGIESYDKQMYRTAIDYFNQAIKSDPGNSDLYFYRAKARMQIDSCGQAIDDYSRAIILDKNKVDYFVNRGLARIACQNYYYAILDFDYASIMDSLNSQIYFNRAFAKESIEDYSGAIEDYSFAISYDSTNYKYFINRGLLFSFLDSAENAINDFSTAINLNTNIIAYKNRGDEYYRQGDFLRAISDYTTAIEIEPENEVLYYSRAEANLGLGEFLAAVVDYTYIISLDQTDATAYYNRGICYANLNMKSNACEDFNRAGELGMFEAYEVIKEYCQEEEQPKVKKKK